jgi:hypothetical protein
VSGEAAKLKKESQAVLRATGCVLELNFIEMTHKASFTTKEPKTSSQFHNEIG